jgi:hypothetical protein
MADRAAWRLLGVKTRHRAGVPLLLLLLLLLLLPRAPTASLQALNTARDIASSRALTSWMS